MRYRPSKFTIWFGGALLLFCGLYLGERAYKRIFPDTKQDQCSFGPFSNEKYRALLATLRKAPPPKWEPLGAAQPIEDHIVAQFRELTTGTNDIFERIAILHAVMRANGASFLRTKPDIPDPFQAIADGALERRIRTSFVTFIYVINRNDLGYFYPIWPEVLIYVSFSVTESRPFARDTPNSFTFFSRNAGNIQDGYVGETASTRSHCPEIPTVEWWQNFEKDAPKPLIRGS